MLIYLGRHASDVFYAAWCPFVMIVGMLVLLRIDDFVHSDSSGDS